MVSGQRLDGSDLTRGRSGSNLRTYHVCRQKRIEGCPRIRPCHRRQFGTDIFDLVRKGSTKGVADLVVVSSYWPFSILVCFLRLLTRSLNSTLRPWVAQGREACIPINFPALPQMKTLRVSETLLGGYRSQRGKCEELRLLSLSSLPAHPTTSSSSPYLTLIPPSWASSLQLSKRVVGLLPPHRRPLSHSSTLPCTTTRSRQGRD
jgi:hypothetical protein